MPSEWPYYLLAANYASAFLFFLTKSAAYAEQIGRVRHGLYHEDLQQMHWERCVLAGLPHFAMWVLMLVIPIIFYFPQIADFLDPLRAELELLIDTALWALWAVTWFLVFICGCALIGALYYNVWRKAHHVERYNELKDWTIMTNAAYGPAHWRRQIMLRRRK